MLPVALNDISAFCVSGVLLLNNLLTMIKRMTGEPNIHPFKKAASEAFDLNDVVTKDSSGYLTKATATTPRSEIIGLIQRAVASTDSDYASNTMVEVDVPEVGAEFDFDVDTGSAVQSMVGKKYDINDEDGLNVNLQLTKAVEVLRILSTTKVRGKFRIHDSDKSRYVTYQQSVAYADFVDGGGATGSLALTCTIPAGAVFVQSLITAITGFAGDTTATIQIGDTGGDVDRYSTGTPDVFATAAAGVDLGVPSGTKWHTAAVVPDVLITKGSDWGTGTSGSATITLIWIEVD